MPHDPLSGIWASCPVSVYTARRITLGAAVAITVDAFGAIFDGAGVAQVCGCPLFSLHLPS